MALTTQEAVEAGKVVLASVQINKAINVVANGLRAAGDGAAWVDQKAQLTSVTEGAIQGMARTENTLLGMLWLYAYLDGRDRAADLATGWQQLDQAISELTDTKNAMAALPIAGASDAAVWMGNAISYLSSIDRTLTFASPFPADYPRIIGPHGNFSMAQESAQKFLEYITEGPNGLIGVAARTQWPNVSAANTALGDLLDATSSATSIMIRVIALTSAVVTDLDASDIQGDSDASSHLRPLDFFRALKAHELAMTSQGFNNFHGRAVSQGISGYMHQMSESSGRVLKEYIRVDPTLGLDDLGAPGGFNPDLGVLWSSLDQWSDANLLFFFEIPLPPVPVQDGGVITFPGDSGTPSTIPSGYFDAEIADLDQIIADATAAKAALTAKIGTQV